MFQLTFSGVERELFTARVSSLSTPAGLIGTELFVRGEYGVRDKTFLPILEAQCNQLLVKIQASLVGFCALSLKIAFI